ncbi:PREDICTED: uncharacterized protein LOC109584540 [Amphimedon queenslandica]|uniref:Uncharacterized protein n=1 Tax=Amphimedon queenslandica TaxID=400682 RepID=A0AAN0JGF3_AMPQE|nr:PREDICTED: uncharacterized protein LOC109584540 [Amphimedon queenslandica]|eukprot:XP_019855867.1 PREDICTED: uncharacterized protein LOC109584540 [Amphimedon queenslandica]
MKRLSCTIESLKIIYPRTRSRIVPNNTLVMLKCLTSNCDHLYMTTPKEEDLFNCGNIEKNGTLMCNITITEPVEVICVGTDSKPVVCDSRSSILIEIEDSASDKCTFVEEPTYVWRLCQLLTPRKRKV